MLTVKDLLKIEKVVEEKLNEKFDEKFSLLPSKEEFFSRMDKLSGELKKVSDSQELHQGQHDEINDRFDRIDKHTDFSSV
jgi:hypothetical protein